jgi:hypothetical protein
MEKEATVNNFTHLFPEWLMCSALSKSIKEKKYLWKDLPFHFNKNTKKLSEIFPDLTEVQFNTERQLLKTEFNKWGIEETIYQNKYWSLRPDFMIINKDANFLFLIEAKGGSFIPSKTWEDPKEIKYYEFLQDAKSFDKKGLLYIIPKENEDDCKKCIDSKYKDPSGIMIGYGIWEEMLEFIANSINAVFIDWLVHQSKGISILSQWQKNQTNQI